MENSQENKKLKVLNDDEANKVSGGTTDVLLDSQNPENILFKFKCDHCGNTTESTLNFELPNFLISPCIEKHWKCEKCGKFNLSNCNLSLVSIGQTNKTDNALEEGVSEIIRPIKK